MLDHLDVDVEKVVADLIKGEHKTKDYLAINPNGRVPTLVDDDFRLWEHAAIMQYLAEKVQSSLSPSDASGRADATRWISWMQMHWVPGADVLGFECLAKPAMGLGEPDPAEVERGRLLIIEPVNILDGHLNNSKYMLGDNLSFVDFFVGGSVAYWETCQMPFDSAENILGWYSLLDALPAWQKNFSN